MFNSIGPYVAGAAFCDLYAGCGSVGIEAASRGADPVVLIERDRRAVKAIEANLEHTKLAEAAEIVRGEVMTLYGDVVRRRGSFEIVFADPPYLVDELAALSQRLIVRGEGVVPGGLVVLQHSTHHDLPDLPEPSKVKGFGESALSFFQVAGEAR